MAMASFINDLNNRSFNTDRPSSLVDTDAQQQQGVHARIDDVYNYMHSVVKDLKDSIDGSSGINERMTYVLQQTINCVLNASGDPDSIFDLTPRKKEERAMFVSLGGMDLLLGFFSGQFMTKDARATSEESIEKNRHFWNDLLILLREICFALPKVSETHFSAEDIAQLFTMLSHGSIFDSTVALLEQILGVRMDIFDLSKVPRLYSLIRRFSTRQLAHFCRLLGFVLFFPEDRQMTESAQVLAGKDLLQLRRDRLNRPGEVVDRNQSLVVAMPDFLERLVILLKINNYGPDLVDLVECTVMQQNIMFPTNIMLAPPPKSDWDIFPILIMKCSAVDAALDERRVEDDGEEYRRVQAERKESIAELLDVFNIDAPSDGNMNDDPYRALERRVAEEGRRRGFMRCQSPVVEDLSENPSVAELSSFVQMLSVEGPSAETARCRRNLNSSRFCTDWTNASVEASRKALEFQAMFIATHHTDLLFVLCTLLSGRRKVFIQDRLHELGMASCLLQLHSKLNWGEEFPDVSDSYEHAHGPGCQCNPESTLRIQYLRTVSNSFDRDFMESNIKRSLLSKRELRLLDAGDRTVLNEGRSVSEHERGLIMSVVACLCAESPDSIYRFWLCSCIESFLKGVTSTYKIMMGRSGLLTHALQHILTVGARAGSNLQAAFDLLGELVKYCPANLQLLCEAMDDAQFADFSSIAMGKMVDSNVFLRVLFLTLYNISAGNHKVSSGDSSTQASDSGSPSRRNYLSQSWFLFTPSHLLLGTGTSQPSSTLGHLSGEVDKGCSYISDEKDHDELKLDTNNHLRLLVFLDNHRREILLTLIESVTIHTVNHENICCINTALLICVLEAMRGRLPELLTDLDEHLAKRSSGARTPLGSQASLRGTHSDDARHTYDEGVQDNAWFKNFRELLWFWQEYYLRRGRDRLSLEFSSQIPFHVWNAVVEDLCADDGAESALLGAPMRLPPSVFDFPATESRF